MAAEMNGYASAGLENLFTLYQTLDRRWKAKPLFLRRTLSYNLHPQDPNSRPSPCNAPPAPLQPSAEAEAAAVHGEDGLDAVTAPPKGQSLWELELSASVWVAPNAPQTLAQVGAQLRSQAGVPHLPLFVAFSAAGPVTQADGHIFPVSEFHFRRVPVVQTTKEQAKLVLQLPTTSEGTPQGKLLCILWDDPNEIRMLGQESFSAQHPLPPLDGVPFGQKGLWAHASIPTKPGTPSNCMPVLRKSTISCKSKGDCLGAHFVHVQAAPVLQATLRMKMELRRCAPPIQALAPPNGVHKKSPHPSSPVVLRAAQQVAFVYESGDSVERVIEVTTGWRCPICQRRSSGFEALQLHLLGVHDHFDFFFQQSDGHAVNFKAGKWTSGAKAGGVPSCSAYGSNVEYVHWRGRWSSPEAAFQSLLRKEAVAQRLRDDKRRAHAQPAPESETERSAKRQRVVPAESQHEGTESRAAGSGEGVAGSTRGPEEQGSAGRGHGKEEAAERSALDEGNSRAPGHDRRDENLAGDLAEYLDAAGHADDPPRQPHAPSSQLGADDTDRDSGARGEESPRAAHKRQCLNGSLEPHHPSPDPEHPNLAKVRARSESIGAASSAGESGAGPLQVTPTVGDGGEAGSDPGDLKMVAVKKKGGSKAKRKPLDTDRNMENLQMRTFYHSRTGMPMELGTVIHGPDSEDELDEEELLRDDQRMLNDFTDVSLEEKEVMIMWNCFARQQRIAADAHMSWAGRAFAEVHKDKIGSDPSLRRVFMLMLVKFWNCALMSAEDVDDCLKTVDSASGD